MDWVAQTWNTIVEPFRAFVEILILTIFIYKMSRLFHKTRGMQVLLGVLVVLVALAILIQLFHLEVISWILIRVLGPAALICLAVIFQPELRTGFARLGAHPWFSSFVKDHSREFLDALSESCVILSNKRFGALFAIERAITLKPQVESGIFIDAVLSKELVLNIFYPKTALHDGGVVLNNDRIMAASCIFPVSQKELKDRTLGLRHRAGIGLAESTDAIVIVVSEETGTISLAYGGTLERNLTGESLRSRLDELIHSEGGLYHHV